MLNDSDSTYFDLTFTTNQKRKGFGFECTVSCAGKSISTVAPQPPPAFTCECGLPNRVKKIVGGKVTESNEYPWQVKSLCIIGAC